MLINGWVCSCHRPIQMYTVRQKTAPFHFYHKFVKNGAVFLPHSVHAYMYCNNEHNTNAELNYFCLSTHFCHHWLHNVFQFAECTEVGAVTSLHPVMQWLDCCSHAGWSIRLILTWYHATAAAAISAWRCSRSVCDVATRLPCVHFNGFTSLTCVLSRYKMDNSWHSEANYSINGECPHTLPFK